jgi:hypothetical protein
MKNKNIKLIIFIALSLSMIYYIGWVFYMSEPKYIDNCNKKVEKYDYVSLPEHKFSFETKQEVKNGIVLQVDSTKAIVKCTGYNDKFYEIDLKESQYRIIGKGTIYHKVNNYVGFNIMLITQLLIGALCAIIIITLISTFKQIF